ncbi:hypothetical protein F1559_004990 [Cyanidiococcus yangmingshanensis]|uniref:Uncharacterized protein n=1 Tax=Cyanidiococcus yangmingshanensis TaxID=2690220 RepID=A0A7J7INH2_9RHOD|nr:hypothetical protein F1559_004990 [Cyanidiococcus yangmingshanensis]
MYKAVSTSQMLYEQHAIITSSAVLQRSPHAHEFSFGSRAKRVWPVGPVDGTRHGIDRGEHRQRCILTLPSFVWDGNTRQHHLKRSSPDDLPFCMPGSRLRLLVEATQACTRRYTTASGFHVVVSIQQTSVAHGIIGYKGTC